MKYTNEQTLKLVEDFKAGIPIEDLAVQLSVPKRSIIAKLASLGEYKRKPYTDKNGEPTIRKEEYVERIAVLLGKDVDLLNSLEKVNKNVLKMLEIALTK